MASLVKKQILFMNRRCGIQTSPKAIEFTIENIEDVFNVNIVNRYGDWIITSR